MNGKLSLTVLCVVFILFPLFMVGQEDVSLSKENLAEMSLEDLMGLEITIGTVTPTTLTETPVSVTVITREDIELAPARNVLDLVEVYVPGATYSNHWLGSRVGIRGVMGDQNTSYLLLLNGKNINMRTTNGPFFEIQNRDLNDIESIEIIRGPGSVTYGHGAIGGIINIITKKEIEKNHLTAGAEVNSFITKINAFVKGGAIKDKLSISYYASVDRAMGEKSPEFFYIDRADGYGYGFMGLQWGNKGLGTPTPRFFADYQGLPQVKAQVDIAYGEKLNLWARFSNISFLKQQQSQIKDDEYVNPALIGKQFISVFEYNPINTRCCNLNFDAGFLSQSNRDVAHYNLGAAPIDDITQFKHSYSQNTAFAELLFNYQFKDVINLAIGGYAEHIGLGPEWGMDESEFLNSYSAPLRFVVYDSTSSGFYQHYGSAFATQVDEKIQAHQFSLYSEIKVKPVSWLSILLSGRVDKHEFSDVSISPRAALVSVLNEKNVIKVIGQNANRYPTFNELYSFNYQGQSVDPEVKKSLEAIYQYHISDNVIFSASGYYNSIDQIAWTIEGYPDVVGKFNLIGTDIELHCKGKKTTGAVSYSFVHQNKWEPVYTPVAYLSNIGEDSIDVSLPNYGVNRINNVPKHTLKFHFNKNLNRNIRFHVNGRFCWGYGQQDMLDSFLEVHETYGTEATLQEIEDIADVLYSYGYAKASFTSNVSIAYIPNFLPSSEIQFYGMNLLQRNNIRYVYQYWEEGNSRQYPRQVGFIIEPASVGVKWIWHVSK